MFRLEEYTDDLRTICAMDSGKGNEEGAQQVRVWFEERYRALGLQTQVLYKDGHTAAPVLLVSNMQGEDISTIPEKDILKSKEKIDVLFIAHMDTVFDTETVRNWPLSVDEKGIGSAPGCIDCKGGCLLTYYLIRDLLEEDRCHFSFVIAYNSDEETGSKYSMQYFEELAERTTYCLVFEPGRANDEFVGIRKGGMKFKVTVHGIAAHSGADFEKGANAAVELARWIPQIYELTDLSKGTTLNVAKMSGGLDNGQVPDLAEASVRLLYLEPEEIDRVNAFLTRMQENPYDKRCHIEITKIGTDRPPMYINEHSEKLFEALSQAGQQTGEKVEWVMTGGMSDGNWIAHHGVGTLDGCGPCGAGLHTKDEYIKMATVEKRLKIMKQLLGNLFL